MLACGFHDAVLPLRPVSALAACVPLAGLVLWVMLFRTPVK